MQLYYAPRTRSARPRWALEELGVPYELVPVDFTQGEHKKSAHLAVHPLGKVPALRDGDTVVFESLAICLYLADKHIDRGLAPGFDSPLRAEYYQWCVFSVASMEPAIMAVGQAKQGGDAQALAGAQRVLGDMLAVVERALAGRPFLLGDQFTVADIMMGSGLGWMSMMELFQPSPAMATYTGAVMGRPAFQRAMAD